MRFSDRPLRVVAIGASAQLGGTERVLLDYAKSAFESDIDLTVLLPADGPLVEHLRQLGISVRVVPAPVALLRATQQAPVRNLWANLGFPHGLWQWARALARDPALRACDLVYTVAFKAHLAAALTRRRPRVWHLHEFPRWRAWGQLRRRLAHHSIAVSDEVARVWSGHARIAAASSPAPITVVPNGVDLDRFRPLPPTGWLHQRLGIDLATRLIGMPAVLARWKGHFEVIDAFQQIAERYPDVDLVLIGGQIYDTVAERAFAEELQRSADTVDLVHLAGFIQEIEAVYPELYITLHYSTRPEPFGRVVVESFACGTPVLAADEAGPRTIVETDVNGWLVQPRDVTALSAALATALDQRDDDRRAMQRAARREVEARFSARAFARHVSDVFWKTTARSASTQR